MSMPILSTKLHIPSSLPNIVTRSRLMKQLDAGLNGKLTLISAPAGFGKTTVITSWLDQQDRSVAWLSLDANDSDLARFLNYLVTSLQTVDEHIGKGLLTTLQSPQLPPVETLLTPLINDIANTALELILVLDDYHEIDSGKVDDAIGFLLDYMPSQIHLVMTTREDPQLPLSRLRASGQMTELRASDLRFTVDETTAFLKQTMGLDLPENDILALETRTEGWIVGLQLAAVSMRGLDDISAFVDAFSGNHQYVLDYLMQEVLQQQPDAVQDFLIQTSVLERFCADLSDATTQNHNSADLLEYLYRANLFLIPLDHQRKWFRYHHLFGDLLRQRLHKHSPDVRGLHQRASVWYEQHGFELDAFQHAVSANHIERAADLVSGADVPLYFRGVAHPILRWLESLSDDVLDANPSLWVMYGWVLMTTYQNERVEAKLQAAESTISRSDRNLSIRGEIAAIRAMLAANQYQVDMIIEQSQLALNLLRSDDLYLRAVILRTLAIAYQFQGKRKAARESYLEAIELSEASDNLFVNILATTGLGIVQLSDNRLRQAEQTFKCVLELIGDPPTPMACVAYLRLARIYYEWNDLNAAQHYAEIGVELARQIDTIDSATAGEIFLAKLKLIQGDLSGADDMLLQSEQDVHLRQFKQQIPSLIEVQVRLYLQRGDTIEASQLALAHDAPLSQARVYLAQHAPQNALDVLTHYAQQVEEQDWIDERLKVMLLQALAYQMNNQPDETLRQLQEVMRLAKSEGFVRLFVDEGKPMQQLLSELYDQGFMRDYTHKLISAFDAPTTPSQLSANQTLIEPLSERELEILQLVAEGLSNQEISDRLYLALSTVKGHNRNIYSKLGVSRRTEAVAIARELGLLQY